MRDPLLLKYDVIIIWHFLMIGHFLMIVSSTPVVGLLDPPLGHYLSAGGGAGQFERGAWKEFYPKWGVKLSFMNP